jgi:hypothetical protein
MGPLVAVGGLHVPGESLRELEIDLDSLCEEVGFPQGQEFKWSPPPNSWMRSSLIEEKREAFFLEALGLAQNAGAKAIVVLEDTSKRKASRDSPSHEDDVTMLFFERAQSSLGPDDDALVVFDRPGGDRRTEFDFLERCIDRIRTGTAYTKLDRLALALATDSKLSRTVQLADVVTACSTSFVAGNTKWSSNIFNEGILPLLREDYECKGGRGLKIHPDLRYGNLYHWLLGDRDFVRYQGGEGLPSTRFTAYRNSGDKA